MRRKRNGRAKGTVADNHQDARSVALEWRKRLQIDGQYQPDIALILRRPKAVFPNIRVRTFPASEYRKQRVRGWANTQTRTINIADDVEIGLKYGDPKSRWEATHELAHVALGHKGNNLLMGKPYPVEDRKHEEQVEDFIFEFLSPFHLAEGLASVEEYERRFGIARDKAIVRKHQVDELKARAAVSIRPELSQKTEETNLRNRVVRRQSKRTRKGAPQILPEQFHLPFLPRSQLLAAHQESGDVATSHVTSLAESAEGSSRHLAKLPDKAAGISVSFDDQELIRSLVQDVNRKIDRYRRSIKASVGLFTIALMGGLPLLTETVDGKIKIDALAVSGLLGAALAFLQVFDRPIGLDKRIEVIGWSLLKTLAEKRGAARKLATLDICYEHHKFIIRN